MEGRGFVCFKINVFEIVRNCNLFSWEMWFRLYLFFECIVGYYSFFLVYVFVLRFRMKFIVICCCKNFSKLNFFFCKLLVKYFFRFIDFVWEINNDYNSGEVFCNL